MATKSIETEATEVRAVAKYVRVSPSKARLVVDLIVDVEKVLRSAVANAENNNGLRADNLVVAAAYVDEGPTLKRIRPRAKGSASRILKRTSHITVVVAPRKEA